MHASQLLGTLGGMDKAADLSTTQSYPLGPMRRWRQGHLFQRRVDVEPPSEHLRHIRRAILDPLPNENLAVVDVTNTTRAEGRMASISTSHYAI